MARSTFANRRSPMARSAFSSGCFPKQSVEQATNTFPSSRACGRRRERSPERLPRRVSTDYRNAAHTRGRGFVQEEFSRNFLGRAGGVSPLLFRRIDCVCEATGG